jgi:hypothetical protein
LYKIDLLCSVIIHNQNLLELEHGGIFRYIF